MKKNNNTNMNMMLVTIVVAVVGLAVGFYIMKRSHGGLFMKNKNVASDLVVVNDSKDTFSTAFMFGGKMMSQVVHPGEKASGGKGLLRIFVAKKNGNYEIQYPYPRPAGTKAEITLTQV